MPVERLRLEQALLSMGFVASERDHRVFRLLIDGKPVVSTQTSRGSGHRTIGDPLMAEIARQLHVSRRFLYQLVRSEKSRDDYLNELRRKGLL